MAVNKLTYGGIQITFGIRTATPVITAPRKNLLLVGPCYYVVDVFDSDGAFNTQALLSGPATLIGSTAMENPGGRSGAFTVNGTEVAIAFAAGTWSIGQVIAYINDNVDGVEAFLVGTDRLGVKTDRVGASASLRASGTMCSFLGFTAGETVYGYGSYTEASLEVPFTTLPDPRGILDQSVLDEDSIDIYANVAGESFHFSADTAFERNGYYCPTQRSIFFTDGSSRVVGTSSPYLWRATTLRPWDPQGGAVRKFWGPVEDAFGYIPATPTDTVNVIKMKAKGVRSGVDGAFKTGDVGDYAGEAGNNLYVTISNVLGPSGVVVTAAGFEVSIQITGTVTLQQVIDAIEAHATASLMLDVDLISGAVGTTATADWTGERLYLGGGVNPLNFAGADGTTEPGGEFTLRGDRIDTSISMLSGDYIEMAVEGGGRTRVSFQTGDDLDAVIAAINTAFGEVVAAKDSTNHFLVLTGPTTSEDKLGFKSSLAIYGSNCINRLFIKDTISNIETVAGTNSVCVVIPVASGTGVVEGDTIKVTGGTATAIVHRIGFNGGNLYMYLSEPSTAFLPEIGESTEYVHIDIISQLAVSSFTGHRHHGHSYMTQANDRLWAQGAVKSVITSSNTTVSTTGDVPGDQQSFLFAAIELADIYGLTNTFSYWYVEARGCEGSDGATKPFPSMVIDSTLDVINLFNDAIVDSYGRSPVSPSYSLYAGYRALRQDISPRYMKGRMKISGPQDLIDKLDPIAPLENPLGYAAYMAMLASGALYEFYVLAIPTDDISGYLECVPVMKKYPDWCIVPLTDNDTISQLFGSFIGTMARPDMRREAVAFLTSSIPTETYPTTLGSAAGCASNEEGLETTIVFDPSLFSLSAVLTAAGLDPETLTSADNVYIQLSGGGTDEEESLRKYLISSVDTDLNTALLKITFSAGENADSFYSTETPPVVSEADVSMFQRGDAIPDSDTDTKLEALQAKSSSYSSRRICLVPNSGVDVDHNGVTTRIDNYYSSAAIGGYTLAHPVELPFSGFVIPGLLHVYDTEEMFDDLDKVTGLWFLQNGIVSSTVETCRQFTTDTSDVKYHEFSITSQLDSLALRVRDALRNWRKKNTGDETLSEQNLQVSAAIDAWKEAREGKSARIQALENHPTLINVHNVIIEAFPFIPVGGVFVYIIA